MKETTRESHVGRRKFLTRSALAEGVMTVAAPFDALLARQPRFPRRGRGPSPDYGPLVPAIDETTGLPLLMLPEAFKYLSFGWTGELMSPVNGFNQDSRGSEFAGACYSPDGKWLFFNIQSPGITFAVTGPWGSGGF